MSTSNATHAQTHTRHNCTARQALLPRSTQTAGADLYEKKKKTRVGRRRHVTYISTCKLSSHTGRAVAACSPPQHPWQTDCWRACTVPANARQRARRQRRAAQLATAPPGALAKSRTVCLNSPQVSVLRLCALLTPRLLTCSAHSIIHSHATTCSVDVGLPRHCAPSEQRPKRARRAWRLARAGPAPRCRGP